MEIRKAGDADAEAVVSILLGADDARVLSPQAWLHMRHTRPERQKAQELVAEDAGSVVGVAASGLDTWAAGDDIGWCNVAVAPSSRRQGVGAALYERAVAHLADIGVHRATAFIRYSEEGERWATARGWSRRITGPLIAVDPRAVPAPEIPEGLRCVPMAELEPTAVYEAAAEAAHDEPRAEPLENLPYEDFLRDWQSPDIDLESSAAVVDGDQVASFAFLYVAGDRAQHGFTGTRRAYRGRGLATTAKRAALRAAAARGVDRVTTSNAEQNAAMRAINRKLGFEPIGEHVIIGRDF